MSAYTHIIHLADLHIRTGNHETARVKEYTDVLKKLTSSIKALPCIAEKTAIIVLCGDIFHNKTKLESTTVKLWNLYRKALTKLAPVVMICGNHDYRQEDSAGDSSCPDIIEVLIDKDANTPHGSYPLTYLSETGTYEINNLIFSLVSIKDTLKSWDSHGIREDLPPFPVASSDGEGKINVGLFHGTITQSALPNGQCMAAGKGYPLEWFKGVDLLLLGDNHKQQIHTSKWGMPWAYPGSLIQQDHGEPVYGHGYVLWDLNGEQISGKAVHVPNTVGFLKASVKDDAVFVKCDARRFVRIEEVASLDWFPREPSVIVVGNVGDETVVRDALQKYGIAPSSLYTNLNIYTNDSDGVQGPEDVNVGGGQFMDELALLNHPSKWLEYIEMGNPELAAELRENMWLEHPNAFLMEPVESRLSSELATKVNERREKLLATISTHSKLQEKQVSANKVVLKHMKWGWALSYGEKNHFDFESMEGNIGLLNGPNASGKSGFIDVLSIALFGEPTKCRSANTGRKMSSHYIHHQRPPKSALMNVSLLFEVNDELYEIHRSYINSNDKGLAQIRECNLSKVDKVNRTKTPVERVFTATDVDHWISRHVGSIEEAFMTAIVNQFDNSNFFSAKPGEQKAIIDQALNMEAFKSYTDIVHQAVLGYNALIGTCSTILQTLDSVDGEIDESVNVDEMKEEHACHVARAEELEQLKESLLGKSGVQAPRFGGIEHWEADLAEAKKALDGHADVDTTESLSERRGAVVAKCAMLKCKEGEATEMSQEALTQRLGEISEELQQSTPAICEALWIIELNLADAEAWVANANFTENSIQVYQDWASSAIKQPDWVSDDEGTDWVNDRTHYDNAKDAETAAMNALAQHEKERPSTVDKNKSGLADWEERLGDWNCLNEEAAESKWPALDICKKKLEVYEKHANKVTLYEQQKLEHDKQLNDALMQLKVETKAEWLGQIQAWTEREEKAKEYSNAEEEYQKALNSRNANMEMKLKLDSVTIESKELKEALNSTAESWGKEWDSWNGKLTRSKKYGWVNSAECRANLKAAEDSRQKWHSLTSEIERIRIEYDELCQHPFNADCVACRTHPSHQRKLKLSEALKNNELELESLGPIESIDKAVTYWTKGLEHSLIVEGKEPWITERKLARDKMIASLQVCKANKKALTKALSESDGVDETLEYWTHAKQELNSLEKERPLMTSRIDNHNKEIARLNDIIQNESAQIKALKARIKRLDYDKNAHEEWERAVEVLEYIDTNKAEIESEIVEWDVARVKWLEIDAWDIRNKELQKELEACQSEVKHWHYRAWWSWSNAAHEIEKARDIAMEWPIRQREIEELKAKRKHAKVYQKWCVLEAEHRALSYELAKRELVILDNQIAALAAVKTAESAIAWLQLREVKEQLAALQSVMRLTSAQLAVFERTHGVKSKRHNDTHVLRLLQARWMKTRDILQKISSSLVGAEVRGGADNNTFTEWMYVQYILPLFETQINRFLAPIESIKISIQYTAKSINFFIHDRGNVVTLAASSGYQKFIVGLGVRQALTNIGGAGCSLKHMIIDEGFTACDESNLAKVEGVLRHLVKIGNYKSILLVSHLESIKDVIPLKIQVRREGAFSSMRFGSEYPASAATAVADGPKRRGRPKANA